MKKFSTQTKTDLLTHIGIIISAFLILFFGFFFVILPWMTHHGESIVVPELKGLNIEEAKDALKKANLNYEITDSVFVLDQKPLTVFANYPKSGSNVKSKRKIFLTITAANAPMVKFPNIIGRSTISAQNQLMSLGLVFGGVEKIPALEENTILKAKLGDRELEIGDEIPKGSKITFVVGDGYVNQLVDVPSLLGLELDEAELLLLGQRLKLGSIIEEPSSAPAGTVFRQRPAAGSEDRIRLGTPVDVWVSTGQ